jgi:hypothetical protein
MKRDNHGLQYFLRIRLRGETSTTGVDKGKEEEDGSLDEDELDRGEEALLFINSMSAGSPSLSAYLFCRSRNTCLQSDPRILFLDVIQPPDLQSTPVEEYATAIQSSLKQISTSYLMEDLDGTQTTTEHKLKEGNGKEIFELVQNEECEECDFRIWIYVEELETHSLLAQIPMRVSSHGKVPFDVLWNPLVSLSKYFSFLMQNMDEMEEFKEGFEVVRGELHTLLDAQEDERSLLYQKFAVILNHKKSKVRELEGQVVALQSELSEMKRIRRGKEEEEELELEASLDTRLQQRARRGRKTAEVKQSVTQSKQRTKKQRPPPRRRTRRSVVESSDSPSPSSSSSVCVGETLGDSFDGERECAESIDAIDGSGKEEADGEEECDESGPDVVVGTLIGRRRQREGYPTRGDMHATGKKKTTQTRTVKKNQEPKDSIVRSSRDSSSSCDDDDDDWGQALKDFV